MGLLFLKQVKKNKLFFLLFSFYILSSCDSLFFQPSRFLYLEPRLVGFQQKLISFHGYKNHKLYGWFFKTTIKTKAKATLVVYHGNAQNISAFFPLFVWTLKHGYNVFLFDYSGYGGSEGTPSRTALIADSIAAYHWAKKNTTTPLVLVGQSLGSAIITASLPQIKDKKAIGAVILDSGFVTYRQAANDVLAKHWFTWALQPLTYLLISNEYSPKDLFEKISPIPLLIIHGTKDSVIPFARGQKIFELAKQPKTFIQATGIDHIQAFKNPIYQKKILAFLKQTLPAM